jgi:hypothetical protein
MVDFAGRGLAAGGSAADDLRDLLESELRLNIERLGKMSPAADGWIFRWRWSRQSARSDVRIRRRASALLLLSLARSGGVEGAEEETTALAGVRARETSLRQSDCGGGAADELRPARVRVRGNAEGDEPKGG